MSLKILWHSVIMWKHPEKYFLVKLRKWVWWWLMTKTLWERSFILFYFFLILKPKSSNNYCTTVSNTNFFISIELFISATCQEINHLSFSRFSTCWTNPSVSNCSYATVLHKYRLFWLDALDFAHYAKLHMVRYAWINHT